MISLCPELQLLLGILLAAISLVCIDSLIAAWKIGFRDFSLN